MPTSSNRDLTLAEKRRRDGVVPERVDVVVAGHVCLDIIPHLGEHLSRPADLFVPGGLVHIGPATVALGGSVANTGLALHRLGATTRLVGKVGDDLLGKAVLESLRQHDESLSESMVVAPGEATSYTLVISPTGIDRGFLHCPGANDTFAAADMHESAWQDARILHFGYPPLMQSVVADEGHSLAQRFAAAQAAGLLVTLDMAMPATRANAAPVDWRQWLRNVLPYVDVFLPSYDELGVLLPESTPACDSATLDVDLLRRHANELLELGVSVVVIKLGDQGLYRNVRLGRILTGKLGRIANWSRRASTWKSSARPARVTVRSPAS
jgi:sugar/nucleoside kinase (ribokinase family)